MENLIRPILREFKEQIKTLEEALIEGVKDFEQYQRLRAERRVWGQAFEKVTEIARKMEIEGFEDE